MKKKLLITAIVCFIAGMVIGYFRDITSAVNPSAGEITVSVIGGGFIYLICGFGLLMIFGLPLYIMWKKKKEDENR